MHIQQISNQNFGAIVLRDSKFIPKNLLRQAETLSNGKFQASSLEGKRLIDEVIKNDFNTPALRARYNELVNSQKDNPANIYIDLFTADKYEIPLHPDGWFQKATVGPFTFKQQTVYFETPQSPIRFLEIACKYADFLKSLGYKG